MGIGCSEHNISSLMFSQCTKNVLGHNFLACFSEIFFPISEKYRKDVFKFCKLLG